MRASAFEAWSRENSLAGLGVVTERLQTLETVHPLYRFGVDIYNQIQKTVPWLHHLYFCFLEQAALHQKASQILGRHEFINILEQVKPDVVLSTHAHLNHGFFEIARQVLGRRQVRCVTYCGEFFGGYGFSRFWVNPDADLFLGATYETCKEASLLGMPNTKNRVAGFLLKPHFYEPPLTQSAKNRYIENTLQLNPERPIVVLSTGANGANNHIDCLESLERANSDFQIVALCGRDTHSLKRVNDWASHHPHLAVRALPHLDKIHWLMDAASVIFARAGTGTTSEAILRGCPIIFNGLGGVMPQEYITLKFARKYRIASLISNVSEMPIVLNSVLQPSQLNDQRQRIARLRPTQFPHGIFQIIAQLFS